MLFYYIRHGDPIYDPDSLTETGRLQAEVLSEKLSKTGLDRIYCSTSNRAIETARPTCEKLSLEPVMLDFANEHYTWLDMSIPKADNSGNRWAFQDERCIPLFCSAEMRELSDRWYEHPSFSNYNFKAGVERVYNEADRFFSSLGYEHDRFTGKYRILKANSERVALFAHQGFGLLFLSCVLDIPYPIFCTHFDMCHTGVTVIDFSETIEGYSMPRVITLSSDAHLYAKDLPSNFGRI